MRGSTVSAVLTNPTRVAQRCVDVPLPPPPLSLQEHLATFNHALSTAGASMFDMDAASSVDGAWDAFRGLLAVWRRYRTCVAA
jgi:hypothetical protein